MSETPELLSAEHSLSRDVVAVSRIAVVPAILEVACRATGLRFAAVARVTEEKWVACAVRDEISFGLKPGGELRIDTTICNEIRQSGQIVVIDHVAEDARFREHPTPRMYGFQSYISVPIRLPDGRFFGTLCALDPRPAQIEQSEAVKMFVLFADLIAFHLDAQERLGVSESALLGERQQTELQQQFIAVLGHDLRNPLSAIMTGVTMLRTTALDARAGRLTDVIERSANRMAGLIDDVLDFARSRLGGGLPATLRLEPDLRPFLDQVIAEMRTAQPDRLIQCQLKIGRPIICDPARIAQLLSNLLANALTHGDADHPVVVRAGAGADAFELSVTNGGAPLEPWTVERLFQPFARGGGTSGRDGLGLGLYIASQIARAHGGSLNATSTADATCFTFRMPLVT